MGLSGAGVGNSKAKDHNGNQQSWEPKKPIVYQSKMLWQNNGGKKKKKKKKTSDGTQQRKSVFFFLSSFCK